MIINVARALESAARIIETEGWMRHPGQGAELYMCGPNPHCVANTMFVHFPGAEFRPMQDALVEYLGGNTVCAIWDWNDAPGQTKENVIATMRACAAIWRAKQENTDANDTRPQVCIPERSRDEPAGVSGEALCRDTASAGD